MNEVAVSRGLLGLAEWDALNVPGHQTWELVDGKILVAPKAVPFHNRAVLKLGSLLDVSAPPWITLIETEVVLETEAPSTVRVPDLMLVEASAYRKNPPRFTPEVIGLVVEVVSPGSRRTDYVAKRYDYELAKIPYYWIVDLEQRKVTCLELQQSGYVQLQIPAGDHVQLSAPVALAFAWDRLI